MRKSVWVKLVLNLIYVAFNSKENAYIFSVSIVMISYEFRGIKRYTVITSSTNHNAPGTLLVTFNKNTTKYATHYPSFLWRETFCIPNWSFLYYFLILYNIFYWFVLKMIIKNRIASFGDPTLINSLFCLFSSRRKCCWYIAVWFRNTLYKHE